MLLWWWEHGTLCFLCDCMCCWTLSFLSVSLRLISGCQNRTLYNFVCTFQLCLCILWLWFFLVFGCISLLLHIFFLSLTFVKLVNSNNLLDVLSHLLLALDFVLLLLSNLLFISQHLLSLSSLIHLFGSVPDSLVKFLGECVHSCWVSKDILVLLLHFVSKSFTLMIFWII